MRWLLRKATSRTRADSRKNAIYTGWCWLLRRSIIIILKVLILTLAIKAHAEESKMIVMDDCSQYSDPIEIVREKPQGILWVPVDRGSDGGVYLKICPRRDYSILT